MTHNIQTPRGFRVDEFEDLYGAKCSLQESSLATDNAVWFGCNEIGLKKFTPGKGWEDVELEQNAPYGVMHTANTRMHLSQEMVNAILPALQHFAEHGELPDAEVCGTCRGRRVTGEGDLCSECAEPG